MLLQNCVAPYTKLEAVPSRGLVMGNQGILHNEQGILDTTLWRHKSWISCMTPLQNNMKRHCVMEPGTWTKLFFLDELTALAFKRDTILAHIIHKNGEQENQGSGKRYGCTTHAERVATVDSTEVSTLLETIPNLAMVK